MDKSTGRATAWNPDLSTTGHVRTTILALAIANGQIYVGGKSSLPNGLPSGDLFCVDLQTGQITVLGDPNFDVRALVVDQNVLYFGGIFNKVGADIRRRLAAIDLTTGTLAAWDPEVRSATGGTSFVNALILSQGMLYAGGNFATVGGTSRNSVAAIDLATGALTAWDAQLPVAVAGDGIKTLMVSSSNLFIGGSFATPGSIAGNVYSANLLTGALGTFNPTVLRNFASVNRVAAAGDLIYVAGVAGYLPAGWDASRYCLVALNAQTGEQAAWNPSASPQGDILLNDGKFLFAGGSLTSIEGQARQGFAAFGIVQLPPEIVPGSMQFMPPAQFQFMIRNVGGQPFAIQMSEDFIQWQEGPVQTGGPDPTLFIDQATSDPRRFYRIVLK